MTGNRELLSALTALVQAPTAPLGSGLAPVLEFLTVDESGFPFCCLLSCRQLAMGPGPLDAAPPEPTVLVLLRGRRPNDHLNSRRRASLSFVVDDAHGLLRLEAVSSRPLAGVTLWTLRAAGGALDQRAQVLVPMSYLSAEMDTAEGPTLSDLLSDERP